MRYSKCIHSKMTKKQLRLQKSMAWSFRTSCATLIVDREKISTERKEKLRDGMTRATNAMKGID